MIMRHDRPESLYLEQGKRFPCVGQVMRMGGATLIAPDTAVTAAHVAAAIMQREPTVEFGGESFGIKEIILHDQPSTHDFVHDIALLVLNRKVEGIAPALLYATEDEAGQAIYFVGRGNSGNGQEGVTLFDGLRRGAKNVIDSVDTNSLYFDLDLPGAGEELEGINGPGDSGGPTLIEQGGQVYLVGVSSRGVPGPDGYFKYGCGDVHMRVSSYADWIQHPENYSSTIVKPSERVAPELPKDFRGEAIAEFVKAFRSREANSMEQFAQTYRTASALAKRTADERRAWYEQSLIDFGVIELVALPTVDETYVETQMITEIGAVLTFSFTFDPEQGGRLEKIEVN